ncbi:hypothetical protein [Mesorhizobium sp. ES1-3]|uniref:hypothetical protein n=1 Tax=Mesorhizobium sp. ES1-3 TaxID=2876628 RepID=UPI001CCF8A9C|nr:hypothetical protein [Mesorhizobium sp. ES1-3]MBZ9673482.1 hypothetical protein [Mesorhizobium sp. ES1-3]
MAEALRAGVEKTLPGLQELLPAVEFIAVDARCVGSIPLPKGLGELLAFPDPSSPQLQQIVAPIPETLGDSELALPNL